MAVYKVIQNVEAEDKLLGPLTLKGFIYAAGAGVLAFVNIRLTISGVPTIAKIMFVFLTLPPMVLFGVLASPLGREQPTEVWLLSRLRFLIKPKVRKWDQSGMSQLVRITAPKKIEQMLTKNITKSEVNSRLQALANTLDSRGWAIKNVAVNISTQPAFDAVEASTERLAGGVTVVAPQQVVDVHPADDILDEQNNPTAQNLRSMVQRAEDTRKMEVQDRLNAVRTEATVRPATAGVRETEELTADEKALLNKIHTEDTEFKLHPPIIRGGAGSSVVTPQTQADKLELAQSGNDLSVASIARLANHNRTAGGSGAA